MVLLIKQLAAWSEAMEMLSTLQSRLTLTTAAHTAMQRQNAAGEINNNLIYAAKHVTLTIAGCKVFPTAKSCMRSTICCIH